MRQVQCMCLKVSGPDLGSWVGCGGFGLVLDHLWTLLFTETTSKQCPERSHTGSILKGSTSLLFFPLLKHTHTLTTHISSVHSVK